MASNAVNNSSVHQGTLVTPRESKPRKSFCNRIWGIFCRAANDSPRSQNAEYAPAINMLIRNEKEALGIIDQQIVTLREKQKEKQNKIACLKRLLYQSDQEIQNSEFGQTIDKAHKAGVEAIRNALCPPKKGKDGDEKRFEEERGLPYGFSMLPGGMYPEGDLRERRNLPALISREEFLQFKKKKIFEAELKKVMLDEDDGITITRKWKSDEDYQQKKIKSAFEKLEIEDRKEKRALLHSLPESMKMHIGHTVWQKYPSSF